MLFHLSAMVGEFDPGSFFSEVVSSAVCCCCFVNKKIRKWFEPRSNIP